MTEIIGIYNNPFEAEKARKNAEEILSEEDKLRVRFEVTQHFELRKNTTDDWGR